jgi:putative CocE/NonD family hydrolase
MKSFGTNPATALKLLVSLFVLRVVAQLIVSIAAPPWLPPMQDWFSGVIAYPYLLASQVLIIGLMVKICRDVQHNAGFWGQPRRALGEMLVAFGSVYLAVMAIRYAIRMYLYPLERWSGGSIPIFFHWVLASFVLIAGVYHFRGPPRPAMSWVAICWRGLVWLAVILAVCAWSLFQLAPTVLANALDVRAAQYAVRIERSIGFYTSDGTRLVADVYHPQRIDSPPIILVRIPYSKTLSHRLFANIVGRFWSERGYTVVFQGTRGRYESTGHYQPLIHEESDGKATLQWLRKQSWFSERIGMWGGSYFGYTQLVLADATQPQVSAFIVQLASTDFSKMFYTDGAFALESALQWALGSYKRQDSIPSQDRIARASRTVPLVAADERVENTRIDFLHAWLTNPPGSDYWQRLDATHKLRQLKGPILWMAGWFDPFLPAQLESYQQVQHTASPKVARDSHLIIGPWAHARSVMLPDGFQPRHYRLESLAPSLDWFDEHLLAKSPRSNRSKVRIFVMGINRWRNEREWPLNRAVMASYFLHKSGNNRIGRLSHKPVSREEFDTYIYDPINPQPSRGGAMIGPNAGSFKQPDTTRRKDVLCFDSETLVHALEVTGYPSVLLTVQTTAPNTDFSARLMDVFPDGTAFNVSEGIVRQSFDGPPRDIQIQLWPTSYVFKASHKIRLEISSSNFPRFDRNLNTEGPNSVAVTANKARQTIGYGRSALRLPIVTE